MTDPLHLFDLNWFRFWQVLALSCWAMFAVGFFVAVAHAYFREWRKHRDSITQSVYAFTAAVVLTAIWALTWC